MRYANLTYFKTTGKYYSEAANVEVWTPDPLTFIRTVRDMQKAGTLPGLVPSSTHEHWNVLVQFSESTESVGVEAMWLVPHLIFGQENSLASKES